jgi:hypothetical protein
MTVKSGLCDDDPQWSRRLRPHIRFHDAKLPPSNIPSWGRVPMKAFHPRGFPGS